MSKTRRFAWSAALFCAWAGLLLLIGCATCTKSTSAQDKHIVVKVRLHGWHDLYVEVNCATINPVELCAAYLPWEWRYSMWVKAFEDDATGSALDERLTVEDLPISDYKVSLMPGKPLHGNIDLRDRYPELEDVLKRRDVIIFWSYFPELSNGNDESRLSGSLIIPKFSKGKGVKGS